MLSFVLAAHAAVLAWGIADMRIRFFGRVYVRNKAKSSSVALTFDDGPDPAITPDILRLLARHGLKATFFVVAREAERYPEIVREAFAQGHTIACHDLTHSPWANFRSFGRMLREIGEAQRIVAAVIGREPLLYRPPVGLMNPSVIPVLDRLSMACIGWSRAAREGGNRIRRKLYSIARLASPGEVILLHDCLPKAECKELLMEQFAELFGNITRAGLKAETVDEFFSLPPYR
jgi:peptidoglycan/xylan/chitin deacetylase (PgdA/CDA1 family)